MISEAKIIFDNIRALRHLLTEGVGENVIIDAIDNHEFIYLYYNGDDNVEKGYRTIRPMALGTTAKGKAALRAWQDKGRSQSLGSHAKRAPRKPAPKGEHERWTDVDGTDKPGWRLFLVDKISKIYPIGEKFEYKDGTVMIPPDYKEGTDKQMSLRHWVKTTPAKTDVTNVGDLDKPKVITKPDVPAPEAPVKTKGRWNNFMNANPANREVTPELVQKWYDIGMNVQKKGIGNQFIAIDNDNKFYLKPENIRSRFPQNAIVGNLRDLYNDYVLKNRQKSSAEDDFARKEKELFDKSIGGDQNNSEI